MVDKLAEKSVNFNTIEEFLNEENAFEVNGVLLNKAWVINLFILAN